MPKLQSRARDRIYKIEKKCFLVIRSVYTGVSSNNFDAFFTPIWSASWFEPDFPSVFLTYRMSFPLRYPFSPDIARAFFCFFYAQEKRDSLNLAVAAGIEEMLPIVTQFVNGILDIFHGQVGALLFNAVRDIRSPALGQFLDGTHIKITVVKKVFQ